MMLRERTDGTQIGEDAAQEPDEKTNQADEKENLANQDANAAQGGSRAENLKNRRQTVADVGKNKPSATKEDGDVSATTPGSPSAHQVSASMVKAACASRARDTRGSDVTTRTRRHSKEIDGQEPIVEVRKHKHSISNVPRQVTEQRRADIE